MKKTKNKKSMEKLSNNKIILFKWPDPSKPIIPYKILKNNFKSNGSIKI